ncbi:MAG: NitT/TauT family transport system ATP-binding protein [Alphaproteobacteria bacterium]|nr:NitT/TauT family transport system ATP-binding protein [Alphaproteobacteria bacterium]
MRDATLAIVPAAAAANLRAPLISARGLSKTYASDRSGSIVALSDVNFDIADGEFISLVGPSGCGKSTLLRLLAGLLPSTTGSLHIGDKPLRGPGRESAVVFQSPVLLPWRTIVQNVLLPIEFRRLPIEEFRPKAIDLLAMVGLADFADRFPHELSGGMQQRAAIVRALVQNPRLLLMDEPFGALDAMTRERLQDELVDIWTRTGLTVLFVTHAIDEAIFLADRVVVMSPGPGRIDNEFAIDLPRPRDIASPEFNEWRRVLSSQLHSHHRRKAG